MAKSNAGPLRVALSGLNDKTADCGGYDHAVGHKLGMDKRRANSAKA